MAAWWDAHPGRLEYEQEALDTAGIEYVRDNDAFAQGVVCLDLTVTVDDSPIKLRATFPDLYPYFRFEVSAPELGLAHHQHAQSKNLCLIARSTRNWHTDDTLAGFLTDRLPEVLRTGKSSDRDEVSTVEQHQPEPFSDYYTYEPGAAVTILGQYSIDGNCKAGNFLIGSMTPFGNVLNGVLLEVRSDDERILAEVPEGLRSRYDKYVILGRWVRLEEPVKLFDSGKFFEHLYALDPKPHRIDGCDVPAGRLQVRGAVFPEEVRDWRDLEQGWIFACRLERQSSWQNMQNVREGKGRSR